MKRSILLLLFFCFSGFLNAQENQQQKDAVQIKERVPTYPGCTGSTRDKMNCLATNLRKIVATKFNGDRAKCLEYGRKKKKRKKGKERKCLKQVPEKYVFVKTFFVIDTTGSIVNIEPNSPYKSVNEEVVRVLKKVPKIEPAMQRGRKVKVKMSLPIRFHLR